MEVMSGIRACFVAASIAVVSSATLAGTTCDPTCAAADAILNDRSNNFANIKNGNGSPHYRCEFLVDNYVCRVLDTPQARVEADFRSSLMGFRKREPGWKWFKATNARYQGPGEIQIYGGPSRGHYVVDMWLARRGKYSASNFAVRMKVFDTTFNVVPCDKSCLP